MGRPWSRPEQQWGSQQGAAPCDTEAFGVPPRAVGSRALLQHAAEGVPEAPGARGSSGFWGNQVQVLVVGDLVQVVAVPQQLPAQLLVHLRGGNGAGKSPPEVANPPQPPCQAPQAGSQTCTCLGGGVSGGAPGFQLPVTARRKKRVRVSATGTGLLGNPKGF